MTEKLKSLMDRESDVEFAAVDLDAIVAAGDRAVRRRRLVIGVASVAAAAVAVTGAVLVAGDDGEDRTEFVDRGLVTDVPMWTVGSTLHTPDATYDLGVTVVALVRTTAGVAYLGDDFGVYSFDGGEPERIGTQTEGQMPGLVGDTDGTLVGWVDSARAEPELVVRDLATGEESRFGAHIDPGAKGGDERVQAYVFAIDGSTVYWLDSRGTVATDLGTGEARVLARPPEPVFVAAAEDGLTLRLAEDASGGDLGTDLIDGRGRVVLGHRDTNTLGSISPDGRWAASVDGPTVWEVGTGRQIPLDVGGSDGVGYDWLDGDTLMALRDNGSGLGLLRCELPAGSCAEVARVAAEQPFALPSAGLLLGMAAGLDGDSGEVVVEASPVAEPEG